jgi:chromosome partitioning protein
MTKHICVINWKGGCGKTTIATHLAVALATSGLETGLADYDRQETAKLWEKLRPKDAVTVSLVNWRKDFGACPASLQRLIVDCPPSLRTKRVRAIIAESNIAVVPLLPSIFDEMATLHFLKRLEAIKSVRKHKKRVLLVANRYRTGRSASRRLEEFLGTEGLLLTARIPEREIYSDLARDGLTVFDRTSKIANEQQQAWLPLVRAVEMSWHNLTSPADQAWKRPSRNVR